MITHNEQECWQLKHLAHCYPGTRELKETQRYPREYLKR